jgi:putative IMPACT (imprinted ancient) family translation regulator
MIILDNVITDRGSKYAVSGGPCHSTDGARTFLADLKRNKRFAKATHNSWGLICGGQMIKNDDGEAGAGIVILRMLEREGLSDHIVVVTRWFGGKHLGGDRFRHVQEAVRTYIKALSRANDTESTCPGPCRRPASTLSEPCCIQPAKQGSRRN